MLFSGCIQNTCDVEASVEVPVLLDAAVAAPTKACTESKLEGLRTSGFNCLAVKDSDNSSFVNNRTATWSGSSFSVADYFWPSSGTLSFYAVYPQMDIINSSGVALVSLGSPTSRWAATTDVVCAKAENVTNGTVPNLEFEHILTWVSGVRLTSTAGNSATITVNSFSVSAPSYGTYNMGSSSWPSTGSQATFVCTSTAQTVSTSGTTLSISDFLLIPSATCTLNVTYTVGVNGVVEQFVKTAQVSLAAGHKNVIVGNLSNDLSQVSFSVSVRPWIQEEITANWN